MRYPVHLSQVCVVTLVSGFVGIQIYPHINLIQIVRTVLVRLVLATLINGREYPTIILYHSNGFLVLIFYNHFVFIISYFSVLVQSGVKEVTSRCLGMPTTAVE